MAANPLPHPELELPAEHIPGGTIVHCKGRITSETTEQLKASVKPLFEQGKTVVLDLTDVSYMDSSGLGTIVGMYISAKAAHSRLKLVNLNQRLKELFSITRLGEVMSEGRDPNDFGIP
jgi:anti-sigma B factor antagonist